MTISESSPTSIDQQKIKSVIQKIDQVLKKEPLSDKEFLVLIANFLFALGSNGVKSLDAYKDLNIVDATKVEVAFMKSPENIYLASLLQSHAILKWSENLK